MKTLRKSTVLPGQLVQVTGLDAILLDAPSWDKGKGFTILKENTVALAITTIKSDAYTNEPNVLVLVGLQIGWICDIWLKLARNETWD